MNTRQGYIGIDRFRIVAALLVVAVHTSPLLTIGDAPDFFFTQVLARIGVPFFLATTGFFLLAPYATQKQKKGTPVFRFVKKTALIYAIAVILYLPVNLYAGHWDKVHNIWQAAKMVFIDGTMYHLWYLPAAIFAVLLVWVLLRRLGLRAVTVLSVALYVIGLLGDNYYGVVAAAPALNAFYNGIFVISAYTRNGLFYAPIFLLAGVWGAKYQALSRKKSFVGLCGSLVFLLAEGALLYVAGGQRHNSMYLALPACTFFLIVWLASFRGASAKRLRDISLIVFIIHPMVIVLVRGGAKWLGVSSILVGNSIIHYVLVCAISFTAAYVLVWLKAWIQKYWKKSTEPKRAWVEVDLKTLAHNVRVLQGLLPAGCKLMPAVKANAYGLGAVPIAKALYRAGVRDYCVASLSEGIELRRQGVRGNILILGYTRPDDCYLVKRYRLMQTVVDYEHGLRLAQKKLGLRVHIKVDTGMHRLGERSEQTDTLCALLSLTGIKVCGIFTQLSCCEGKKEQDIAYTQKQLETFRSVLGEMKDRGLAVPKFHVQCSYGIINYTATGADYARPGLALYGIVDEECCIGPAPDLRPIFSVKAKIALVKPVCAGERIGYGSEFMADTDRRIAVMTMGYADGLPRSLSGGAGRVLVCGKYAPIVGNICMDQAIIDVSHIDAARAGETVVLIGESGGSYLSVFEMSRDAGTIPNEIVSRLGVRLERRYTKE